MGDDGGRARRLSGGDSTTATSSMQPEKGRRAGGQQATSHQSPLPWPQHPCLCLHACMMRASRAAALTGELPFVDFTRRHRGRPAGLHGGGENKEWELMCVRLTDNGDGRGWKAPKGKPEPGMARLLMQPHRACCICLSVCPSILPSRPSGWYSPFVWHTVCAPSFSNSCSTPEQNATHTASLRRPAAAYILHSK